VDEYTLFCDGDYFVAFGLDALWVAGYGPGDPFVSLQVGGGMTIATFRVDVKEVVFDALRKSRKQLDGILSDLVAEGMVEQIGQQTTTLCQVRKLKVSVREFIQVQLEANGVIRDNVQHMACRPVLGVAR